MKTSIIFQEWMYNQLLKTLFSDSRELFAFAFAGISKTDEKCLFLVREYLITDSSCLVQQSRIFVKPKQEYVAYAWDIAKASQSSLIRIHTHPFSNTNVSFSSIDTDNELKGFPKEIAYIGEGPHASIVFGKSSADARYYNSKTKYLETIESIKILGHSIQTIIPTSYKEHCHEQ